MKKLNAIKPFFKHKLLVSLILLMMNSAHASMVRGDVDYQYFRDFAENKGQFSLDATNVEILDKNGQSVGTMLKDVPMIDLSVATRGNGVATLVKPQYVVSVQHNRGYENVQFGDHSNNNPDSHHFNYQIVERNNYLSNQEINNLNGADYHAPRLHKLVTETTPIATANEVSTRAFLDKNKYPIFTRVGSGTQIVVNNPTDKQKKTVTGPYSFVTGGTPLDVQRLWTIGSNAPRDTIIDTSGINTLFNYPLGTIVASGDSGSGLFAWDAQAGRWVYVASAQAGTDNNAYFVSILGYADQKEQLDIAGTVIGNEQTLLWTPSANSSTISANGQELLNVGLADANLAERDGVNNGHWFRPRQDHGKTFTISGENNTLRLADNIDQGAGAIYFTGNTTVEGVKEGTTWLGAGVSIDKDRTVTWKIGNPDKDRLSKIGEGTLLVQGVGKNLGSISVGDGTVILDQRVDVKNEKQAFSEVGIVSGRSTVVLNSADQVNPDHIYFGFRGGRLDVNGHDLTFNRIQNADEGARIVNHNQNQASNITVKGVVAPKIEDIQLIPWEKWSPTNSQTHLYEDRRYGYYILRGRWGTFIPGNPGEGKSDENWEFLSTNKEEALALFNARRAERIKASGVGYHTGFNGILGENDEKRANGELNIAYNPSLTGATWLLSGGSNLNGTLSVENGTLMLSGRPVPHAYDHLNRTEVMKDDEWLNRTFNMTTLAVQDNATAYIGRNVSVVNANLSASQNAAIQAGFINGVTPVCIRSDYNGNTTCTTPTYDSAILDIIPSTAINGNVSLIDNATFTLGKANLTGKISGTALTTVNLSADGVWNMTADSDVGNLNLTAGSVVNLNKVSNAQQGHYQTLNITGNLTGEGLFNYQTNLTQFQGDKVNVTGNASGSHRLNVSNTGTEPTKSKEHLTLLTVKGTDTATVKLANKDEQVDLGAYRYSLRHEGENYYLWSPILEQDIDKAAEEEAKRQEEARKQAEEEARRQEEARKQAEEEARRQEEARKQAEEEARRQEEARKQAEEEAKRQEEVRKQAEEEARRQEEARKQAEEEAKRQEEVRKQAEEEAKRQEEARKQAEEEARRQEEARKQAEEEAKRQEEARKQAEEEARRQEEARKQAEEEAKRQEEARKQAEEEARRQEEARKQAEEEAKRQEEARKQAEEEARRQEAARKQAEEEAKRQEEARKQAEEEVKRQEEARKQAEEEAKRQEEARKQAEEEARRQEEARKQAEEEARRQEEARKQAEEEVKRQEEARKQAEEEAKRQEEQRKAEEEAHRQEEARKQAEEEAKRQEEARKQAEEEAKRQEEARKQAEEEARRQEEVRKQAEEEAKRQEEQRKAMAQKQQSELISRYANTALSDVSSQVNSVIHVGDNLNRHLLDDSHTGGVWLNVNRYDETEHGSSYYRDYKKQETLTQIGADTTIEVADGHLLVGTAYSHSESNNRFDDNASSDSDLDVLSTYGKLTFKDDSFITADVGYGRTDSTIRSEGEEVKSKRHIGTAGLNVGKTFKTEVVDIQPSVGVRYHYLEGHNYNLNGANVEVKDANVLSYRAGVSLEKSFTLSNGIAITPSISSSYVNTTNSKNMVRVNNHSLKQEFGDYGHHELGVKVGGKQWAVEVHASRSEGNEVNTQNAGGIKLNYQW